MTSITCCQQAFSVFGCEYTCINDQETAKTSLDSMGAIANTGFNHSTNEARSNKSCAVDPVVVAFACLARVSKGYVRHYVMSLSSSFVAHAEYAVIAQRIRQAINVDLALYETLR
jgi:hypothetical protein